MKVRDLHGRGWPVFSFEFFPPKTDEGARQLLATVADLQEVWKPDFVSVTYGAGGTTRERTVKTIAEIIRTTGLDVTGHLTCVDASRDEVDGVKRLPVSDARVFDAAGVVPVGMLGAHAGIVEAG
jgi:methylenetetrahydrofolate reductase (NADPH)